MAKPKTKKELKKIVDSVVAWHELEPTEEQWREAYDEHIMDCCDPEYA